MDPKVTLGTKLTNTSAKKRAVTKMLLKSRLMSRGGKGIIITSPSSARGCSGCGKIKTEHK